MAGYKSTFEGNVDYGGRGVSDIGSRLERGAKSFAGDARGVAAYAMQVKNAKNSIKELNNEVKGLEEARQTVQKGSKEWKRLTKDIEGATRRAKEFQKGIKDIRFDAMEKGLGRVATGLISLNTGILSMGFDFLTSSIKRVYELQERWTKAIGAFNMKMGGTTAGLKGAQKAATQWSSTIRGLTGGDINEGIQMFGEFTMAMGRTVTSTDKFSKLGVQMARGFGIGGAAAGKMLKTFENIGMSADDSAEAMKTSIAAANAAGIPVNMLADDLSKSTAYMARFGKEGQKTLVQGAAWARKYDIALDQLKNSVEGFDMFDDAAKSASKLNTAFGTMINSMDLMMEDDPAKRLDMIRQQMLAQGLTYDTLTPKQVRYFSETMKLSEEQTAALLDSRNAGESYSDFQAKAAANEKKEVSAKKLMEKQLRSTVQTMYAFGMAFDRVTAAIAKAIRPLLEVFGLAKKGGKDFKSFGNVMESITLTVVEFFESLAKNEKWNMFMVELAKDLTRAGAALKDFVMSGRAADLMGGIADGMKSFYTTVRDLAIKAAPAFKPLMSALLFLSKHIELVVAAWAGMKVINFGRSMGFIGAGGSGSKTGSASGDPDRAGGWKSKKSKFGPSSKGAGRRGTLGAAGGLAAGVALGGSGAMAGGAIGGAIGAFFPLIGPLMGPLGAALGKGIQSLFSGGKSKLEESQEKLADATARASASTLLLEKTQAAGEARIRTMDAKRNYADKKLLDIKSANLALAGPERQEMIDRITQLQGFGKSANGAKSALEAVNANGKLTPEMLKALNRASADYDTKLMALRASTDAMNEAAKGSLEIVMLQNKQKFTELELQQDDMDIAELKRKKAIAIDAVGKSGQGPLELAKAMSNVENKFQSAIEKKQLEKLEKQRILQEDTLKVNEQMLTAELRKQLFQTDSFLKFTENQKAQGINDEGNIRNNFLLQNLGSNMKTLGLSGESGHSRYSKLLGRETPKMASGGVVTRPMRAIIGEAGPEAVIPLSRMRNMVRNGERSNGSQQTVVTQIADVTLDGQKVGRALVRSTLQGRR